MPSFYDDYQQSDLRPAQLALDAQAANNPDLPDYVSLVQTALPQLKQSLQSSGQLDLQSQEALPSGQLKEGILSRSGAVTQRFGNRSGVEIMSGGVNYGTDIGVPRGTQVAAPPGLWQVVEAYDKATQEGSGKSNRKENKGYGNSVLIQNRQTGEMLRFSHLRAGGVAVKPGQVLRGGTVFGETGASGNVAGATGQHLDLEYYDRTGKINNVEQSPYWSAVSGGVAGDNRGGGNPIDSLIKTDQQRGDLSLNEITPQDYVRRTALGAAAGATALGAIPFGMAAAGVYQAQQAAPSIMQKIKQIALEAMAKTAPGTEYAKFAGNPLAYASGKAVEGAQNAFNQTTVGKLVAARTQANQNLGKAQDEAIKQYGFDPALGTPTTLANLNYRDREKVPQELRERMNSNMIMTAGSIASGDSVSKGQFITDQAAKRIQGIRSRFNAGTQTIEDNAYVRELGRQVLDIPKKTLDNMPTDKMFAELDTLTTPNQDFVFKELPEKAKAYYRAIDSKNGGTVLGKGVYMGSQETAAKFGSKIEPVTIKEGTKLLDLEDIRQYDDFADEAISKYPEIFRKGGAKNGVGDAIQAYAKKLGYDGIAGDPATFGTVVFDQDNVKIGEAITKAKPQSTVGDIPIELKNVKNPKISDSTWGNYKTVEVEIPVKKLVSAEPNAAYSRGYKPGRQITEPVEVVYNTNPQSKAEYGEYVLLDGNNRVAQAIANGDKTIKAKLGITNQDPDGLVAEDLVEKLFLNKNVAQAPKPQSTVGGLYHGSATDFKQFNLNRAQTGNLGKGIYLTESPDAARQYANMAVSEQMAKQGDFTGSIKGKGVVKNIQVSPDAKIKQLDYQPTLTEANKIKAQGFDGISYPDQSLQNTMGMDGGKATTRATVIFDPKKVSTVAQAPVSETIKQAVENLKRIRFTK